MKKLDEDFFNLIGQAETLYASEIKKRIVANLTEKLFDEFKKNAEDLIKKEAERLVSGHIESWKDIYEMKNHIHVTFEWRNRDSK